MADEIHANDVGTEFRVTVKDDGAVVDISSATVTQIIFGKPDGNTLNKDASFYTDGTDGIMTYTAESGDLDVVGTYKIQGKVTIGFSTFYTSLSSFRVHCNV